MKVVPPVVVDVGVLEVARDVAADCNGEDQGGCDPEGAIEVGLQLYAVDFRLNAGNEGGYEAFKNFVGVDVEISLVEGKAPYRVDNTCNRTVCLSRKTPHTAFTHKALKDAVPT